MVEVNLSHSLTDIIGEIDDMVLKHGNSEPFSEYPDLEQTSNIIESQKNVQNTSCREESGDKGHYRGISFGAVPNQECAVAAGEGKAESLQINASQYIKLLEENNEVLKRSNEVLVVALKDKSALISMLKAKNDELLKQNVLICHTSSNRPT
eukprot:TRINITY_DN9034_c0_g1_i1.p1 TRINITY_DN9034_c0_g1~~TRINITY_DN9034_c0_g1_i1.p1  ORF type:complete len:152 (+),score=34.74 TRINITY_DN9034_c0_g1_i1:103-558(+)